MIAACDEWRRPSWVVPWEMQLEGAGDDAEVVRTDDDRVDAGVVPCGGVG